MMKKEDSAASIIGRGIAKFFAAHPDLKKAGIIVAYSGGVDSAVLLSSLSAKGIRPIRAVHVVHNLRPEEELARERTIVTSTCADVGVPLTIAAVKRGSIEKLAAKKKIGIEAAAREVRYGILKREARRSGFGVICTAHNADDQLETLVARFISSSSTDGLAGIRPLRSLGGNILLARPLLFASRKETERYVEEMGIQISADSTNASADYRRNKIRHILTPLLDAEFPGWRKGVRSTAEKMESDSAALQEALGEAMGKCSIDPGRKSASIDIQTIRALPEGLRIRLLATCIAAISGSERLSYKALKTAAQALDRESKGFDLLGHRLLPLGDKLEIMPILDFRAEDGYFFLMPDAGQYRSGPIVVSLSWDRPNQGRGYLIEGSFSFPLIARSRKAGDAIKTTGIDKRIDDILKSWRLERQRRGLVPIIEDRDGIVAILPSSFEGLRCGREKFRDYTGPMDGRRLFIRIKGA